MPTLFLQLAARGAALAAAVLVCSWAHAAGVPGQGTWESTLQARDLNGDKVVDAYYDTSLHVTWLRDANINGNMDWDTANTWASQLVVDGVGGWRLPTMIDTGLPGCDISFTHGTDCGYNVQTKRGTTVYSEMAHLWYVTLGNKGYYDRAGNPEQPGWGLSNTGGFQNLGTFSYYWSGLSYAPDANFAWDFYVDVGYQYTAFNLSAFAAMAVHPGDVLAVPEPNPAALLLVGLTSLIVIRCQTARRSWPQ